MGEFKRKATKEIQVEMPIGKKRKNKRKGNGRHNHRNQKRYRRNSKYRGGRNTRKEIDNKKRRMENFNGTARTWKAQGKRLKK